MLGRMGPLAHLPMDPWDEGFIGPWGPWGSWNGPFGTDLGFLLSRCVCGGGAGAQQSTRRGVDAPNLPPLGVVGELEVENVVDAAVHGLVQVERAVRGEEHEPRVALHDRQQRRGVGALSS